MHPAPVVIENRLRHERDSLTMLFRNIANDGHKPTQLICHVQKISKLKIDLTLTGSPHLMVMRLYDHTQIAHRIDHLSPELVIAICGANWKVATLETWLIS